ncbi:hypothetical protein RCL1_006631 [Eukaryota sp. TZLM3-RCL]
MHLLHRLLLNNFKSYDGAHIVGPFRKFSAIIGPNGSGKSNIMDAISFVIGVRASDLRSNALRDLIHKKEGDPGPSATSASVTLVLITSSSLSDHIYPTSNNIFERFPNEVHLTRSINSRGVSEYAINGRTMTFSDFSEALLNDYNISSKLKNFLIFQGDVMNLAQKSGPELTKMIEEISGSINYAEEYEQLEAAKTLANREATSLLKKQTALRAEKKAYMVQKQEAAKWAKLEKDLETTKQSLILFQIFHLEQDIKELMTRHDDVISQEQSFTARFKVSETKQKEFKRKSAKLARIVSEMERKLDTTKQTAQKSKPDVIRLKEQLRHFERRLKQSIDTQEQLIQSNKSREIDINHYKQLLSTIDCELDQLNAQHSQLLQLSLSDTQELVSTVPELANISDSDLQRFNSKQDEARKVTSHLHQEATHLKRIIEGIEGEVSGIEQKRGYTESRKMEQERSIEKFSEILRDLNFKLRENESNLIDFDKKVTSSRDSVDKLSSEIEQIEAEIKQLSIKLTDFNADTRTAQNNRDFNQTVNNLTRLFPGVFGALNDLIKPVDSKFDVATTVALGKYFDSIVVDSSKTGAECIRYLKEQLKPPMSFIPLDSIVVFPINDELRRVHPSIKLMIDLLNFEPKFRPAVQFAVSNTLVSDSLDQANRVKNNLPERCKIVTLDGTVIGRNGFITGGSDEGISRKANTWNMKDYEEGNRNLEKLTRKLQDFYRQKRSLSQFDSSGLIVDRNKIVESKRAISTEIVIVEEKIKTAHNLINSCNRDLSLCEEKILTLRDNLIEKENELSSKTREILSKEASIFNLPVEIIKSLRSLEDMKVNLTSDLIKKKQILEQSRDRTVNRLRYEESKLTDSSINHCRQQIEKDQKDIDRLTKSLKDAEKVDDRLKSKVGEIEEELRKSRDDYSLIITELSQLKEELRKSAENLSKLTADRTNISAQISTFKSNRNDLLMQVTTLGVELPLIDGNVWTGVAITERDVTASQLPTLSTVQNSDLIAFDTLDYSLLDNKLKKRPLSTKNSIKNVVSQFETSLAQISVEMDQIAPNMKADSRLSALQERVKSVAEEVSILTTKSNQANHNFEEVKKKRIELFLSAFKHVERQVSTFYSQLTRRNHGVSGTAHISIIDNSLPFNGVSFSAMPPQKRFRDIDQLSGGEKSVAALALMFAIYSYKPAPFVVLDEVDAALDRGNVARVATFLSSSCRNSELQAIVISLKDTFFDQSESLIGVYKDQINQTSRLLTLDLGKYEQSNVIDNEDDVEL